MTLGEKITEFTELGQQVERINAKAAAQIKDIDKRRMQLEEQILGEMAETGLAGVDVEGIGRAEAETTIFAKKLAEKDEFTSALEAAGFGDLISQPAPSVHGGRLNSFVRELVREEGGIPEALRGILSFTQSTRLIVNRKGPRK